MEGSQRICADAALCRDCQACTLGCSLYQEKECSLGLARLSVTKDMAHYVFDILICQHCATPDCLPACPSEAMIHDERGVVLILDDVCERCGACAVACPYDAIFYNEIADRYIKCDLCAGRAEGPVCVQLCPVGALTLSEEVIQVEV